MRSLAEQLLTAMSDRGWSVQRLLDESGLECDRSSLHRKIHGKQPLAQEEIQALVNALGITVAVMPRAKKRAS